MVDVPALNVRFVNVVICTPPQVIKEAFRLTVLTPVPISVKFPLPMLKLDPVSKVPVVNVSPPVVVNPAVSVHPPPTPLKLIALARLTPALTVHPVVVALNVIAPVYVLVTPVDAIVKLPDIASATEPAMVTLPVAGPDMLKLRQTGSVVRVQV